MNAEPTADTIVFSPTDFQTPQTITLTGTELSLTDTSGATTITGPAAGLIVSGGGKSRVFDINPGVTASISGLTVTGGQADNGGGLANYGAATLGNTIVAGNTASNRGPDADGTFTSQGHNLIGKFDGSFGWVNSDLIGTIASPLQPDLAPLGDYGGPTQTMPLLPGSPASGAGASGAGIPTTDQRGQIRGSSVDIGAFQGEGTTLVVDTTTEIGRAHV